MSKVKKSAPASRRYDTVVRKRVLEKLLDPAYAATYINEALADGDEVTFKTAVADVVRAHGVVNVARAAGIHRVTVSKTLRPETKTKFTTYHSLLNACDIDFGTQPLLKPTKVTIKRKAKRAANR